MTTQRTASIQRATSETSIDLSINLDGQGTSTLTTGVGFFEHMLTQIARHGLVDLTINATVIEVNGEEIKLDLVATSAGVKVLGMAKAVVIKK